MFGLQNRTRTVILGIQKSRPKNAVWMDCTVQVHLMQWVASLVSMAVQATLNHP